MEEKWRKVLKKKMDTKAFQEVGFDETELYPVLTDDGVDMETVPLKTIVEELIWHWAGKLTEPWWCGYEDYSRYQKKRFKAVANNFLKNFASPEIINKTYRRWVRIEDGTVQL